MSIGHDPRMHGAVKRLAERRVNRRTAPRESEARASGLISGHAPSDASASVWA